MSIRLESWILEACVLTLLEQEDAYGYGLTKLAMFNLDQSTIYPTLRRLADKGYLEHHSQTHDSRLRKYYTITSDGKKQLIQARKAWVEYGEVINNFLEKK